MSRLSRARRKRRRAIRGGRQWEGLPAAGGRSRTGLLLWLLPALFELPAVLLMCAGFGEVAAEALFGSPDSEAALRAVLVVGAVVAWRGASGLARTVMMVLLWLAARVTAALAFRFTVGGVAVMAAVLLAHSALSIFMIGMAVTRAVPSDQHADLDGLAADALATHHQPHRTQPPSGGDPTWGERGRTTP